MQLTNTVALTLFSSVALVAALPSANPADSLTPRADIMSMIQSAEQTIGHAGEELEGWLKDYFTGKFANLPVIKSNATVPMNGTTTTIPDDTPNSDPITKDDEDVVEDDTDDDNDDDDDGEDIEARGLSKIFKGLGKGKGKDKPKKPFKPGHGKGDDAPPGVVKGKHQGFCGWPKKSYPKSMGGGTDGRMFCIFASRMGVCTSCEEGKNKEFDECWC